jgi:hypothetical protein
MSKYAMIAILVLSFVCCFLTMVYQYGARGWAYESNPPLGSGHGHGHAKHGEQHAPAPTPGGAVATPMSMDAAPAATAVPAATAAPAATATP